MGEPEGWAGGGFEAWVPAPARAGLPSLEMSTWGEEQGWVGWGPGAQVWMCRAGESWDSWGEGGEPAGCDSGVRGRGWAGDRNGAHRWSFRPETHTGSEYSGGGTKPGAHPGLTGHRPSPLCRPGPGVDCIAQPMAGVSPPPSFSCILFLLGLPPLLPNRAKATSTHPLA